MNIALYIHQKFVIISIWKECMETLTTIEFKAVDIDSIPEILPILHKARSRTCDYTVAGLLMWSDYFKYEYAVLENTLFIKGTMEDNLSKPAFSMPIGEMPLCRAVELIREYCREHNLPLNFSAVPEDCINDFYCLGPCQIEELTDWADYVYRADDLVNLSGNKYNKKRNHIHRFASEHPDYTFEPLSPLNINAVRDFFMKMATEGDIDGSTASEERFQVFKVLENYERYPFEGAVLSTKKEGVVAFTIGEVIGDTLFVHIEKMSHNVNGAGETINRLFAEAMKQSHGIIYVNREEDVGDEGLRKAKMSYHPFMMLKKYNLSVKD